MNLEAEPEGVMLGALFEMERGLRPSVIRVGDSARDGRKVTELGERECLRDDEREWLHDVLADVVATEAAVFEFGRVIAASAATVFEGVGDDGRGGSFTMSSGAPEFEGLMAWRPVQRAHPGARQSILGK
jgi:hypothetical protein